MYEVQISVNNGEISLTQDGGPLSDYDNQIILSVDQIDTIIEWLQEAKTKAQQAKKEAVS